MFLYGFCQCTCLYEWLSIFLCVFVMYMFVRMTIYIILMVFRHVHLSTNDYPFPCGCVFVMHISVRMTIHFFWMGFRQVHVCTNDYHLFLNGLLSCTFLYEWLPFLFEWIVVIYISVRMTTISTYTRPRSEERRV